MLTCDLDPSPSSRIENQVIKAPTRQALIDKYVAFVKAMPGFVKYALVERRDLDMTEIIVTTATRTYSFTMIPRDMKQTLANGQVVYKNISCSANFRRAKSYDPDADLDLGATCGTWVWIDNGIAIQFDVNQQYLPYVPQLHDHFVKTLQRSRKN